MGKATYPHYSKWKAGIFNLNEHNRYLYTWNLTSKLATVHGFDTCASTCPHSLGKAVNLSVLELGLTKETTLERADF